MLTAIITLSVFSGAAAIGLLAQWAKLNKRKNRIEELKAGLNIYRADRDSTAVVYFVEAMMDGKYAVVRRSFSGGVKTGTLIKVFDTEDADYNEYEAIELKDMLNKRLCYN